MRHQISLVQRGEDNTLRNLFGKIRMTPSQSGLYHNICLEGLEAGDYKLRLKLPGSKKRLIQITVCKGTYWQDNFILKKNCLFESSAQKNGIRLEKVEL